VPPTRGADLPEQNEPDHRYFDSAQVTNLVKIARMLDKSWGRMPALIELAFCSGLRSGSLKALNWSDVDLTAGMVTVERTKNGDPIIVPLSSNAKCELEKLPGKTGLVFANKRGWLTTGEKFGIRSLPKLVFLGITFIYYGTLAELNVDANKIS